MKLRWIDRLIIAVAGLLLLLLALLSLLVLTGLIPLDGSLGAAVTSLPLWGRIVLIVVSLLVGVVGVHGIMTLLYKRKERSYVSQENENGRVSISVKALEIMTRKCVENCRELKSKSVRVERSGEGVSISVSVLVPSGVNIPRLIGTLQRQIRKYVSSCSGIPVLEVQVQVETDPGKNGYVPALMAPKVTDEQDTVQEIVLEAETAAQDTAKPFKENLPNSGMEEAAVKDGETDESIEAAIESATLKAAGSVEEQTKKAEPTSSTTTPDGAPI